MSNGLFDNDRSNDNSRKETQTKLEETGSQLRETPDKLFDRISKRSDFDEKSKEMIKKIMEEDKQLDAELQAETRQFSEKLSNQLRESNYFDMDKVDAILAQSQTPRHTSERVVSIALSEGLSKFPDYNEFKKTMEMVESYIETDLILKEMDYEEKDIRQTDNKEAVDLLIRKPEEYFNAGPENDPRPGVISSGELDALLAGHRFGIQEIQDKDKFFNKLLDGDEVSDSIYNDLLFSKKLIEYLDKTNGFEYINRDNENFELLYEKYKNLFPEDKKESFAKDDKIKDDRNNNSSVSFL